MSSTQVLLAYPTAGILACAALLLALMRWQEKSLGRVSILYGPILVGLIYLTWVTGRAAIGHWPHPNLDDPSTMKVIPPLYFSAGVWMLLLPLAVMLPVVRTAVACLARDKSWAARVREGAAAYALLAVSVAFLRLDPNRVLDWFMD